MKGQRRPLTISKDKLSPNFPVIPFPKKAGVAIGGTSGPAVSKILKIKKGKKVANRGNPAKKLTVQKTALKGKTNKKRSVKRVAKNIGKVIGATGGRLTPLGILPQASRVAKSLLSRGVRSNALLR